MKVIAKLLVLVCAGAVVGCAVFRDESNIIHDRRDAYRHSREGKKLDFPPDLRSADLSTTYEVPPVEHEITAVSLTPPGSLAEREHTDQRGGKTDAPRLGSKAIRINTRNAQWVMTVYQPLTQSWDAIETALKKQNIQIQQSDKGNHQYRIVNEGQSYQLNMKPIDAHSTQISLNDVNGKPASVQATEVIFNQLSDGLKGQTNLSLLERLIGR